MMTVASNLPYWAGALKPSGTLATSVILPAPVGLRLVAATAVPPTIVSVESGTAPTSGFELVTLTFTDRPPATAWTSTYSPAGPNNAAQTAMFDGVAPVVVSRGLPNVEGPFIRIPEGARVTVAMLVPYPGARSL